MSNKEILVKKISPCYLTIKAPLEVDENLKRLNRLPGYKKWVGRELKFRPTANCINYIYKEWPQSIWQDEAKEILLSHLRDVNEALEAKAKKLKELKDDGSYDYKTAPFKHQQQAFLLSRTMKWFALLMEMGTGKTKILIDTAAYLFSIKEIETLVVIAPNGVHRNWIDIEIPIHLPDWCQHIANFYSSKQNAKKTKEIANMFLQKEKLSIIAINVEAFRSAKAKKMLEDIVRDNKCLVVIDESTTIKKPSAKRSEFIIETCKNCQYKRIATGSPITKGIEDLYSQFKFLSDRIIGYDTYTSFKSRYCKEAIISDDPTNPFSKKRQIITDYSNTEELIEKISPYSIRVLKKNCTDLPDKTYTLWPVELTDEQKKSYSELKEKYITEIEGTHIEEENALVRLMRLQQIICGWYPDENKKGTLLPFSGKNPRLEALKGACQQVEDNGEKAIIWARFKQDILAIEQILGDKAVSYHGNVDAETRAKASNRFQGDDSVRYMVAMLSSNSGAVRGHTWTAASTSIYYSNVFDLDARIQSEDRMHRIGMGSKALYIDLMSPGTIDLRIVNSLRQKKSIADLVTQDGPSGFLNFIKN